MTAAKIDGKAIGREVRGRVAEAAHRLAGTAGRPPNLTVVLVGDDPASHVYVGSKEKAASKAGFDGDVRRLPADTSQAALEEVLKTLAADEGVDGILLQLPLPGGLDADRAIALIPAEKDVDGLTPTNAGNLLLGRPGLVPCTPQGSMILVRSVRPDLAGARAVVIGRSILVGKPLALLLQAADATVTMAHSRTRDLPALAREADILCAAAGRPEMVRGDWVKEGAVVVDVGINRVQGPDGTSHLVGDVAFDEAAARAAHITPVPGGVGPMTIACLLRNTVIAAARRAGQPDPAGL